MNKSNQNAKEFFEDWQPDKFNLDATYQKELRDFSAGFIHGDVLDLGCGSRVYYNLQKAKSWTGVDISKRMSSDIHFIDKTDHLKMEMIVADAAEMDLTANAYDTVCAFFILHHLGRDNRTRSQARVLQTLQHSHAALRAGGKMVIAENASAFLEWPYHWLYSPLYKFGKKFLKSELPYFWRKTQMIAMLKQAGFKSVTTCHFKIEDWIYNPVLRMKIPPLLSGSWIQSMTLYIAEK